MRLFLFRNRRLPTTRHLSERSVKCLCAVERAGDFLFPVQEKLPTKLVATLHRLSTLLQFPALGLVVWSMASST